MSHQAPRDEPQYDARPDDYGPSSTSQNLPRRPPPAGPDYYHRLHHAGDGRNSYRDYDAASSSRNGRDYRRSRSPVDRKEPEFVVRETSYRDRDRGEDRRPSRDGGRDRCDPYTSATRRRDTERYDRTGGRGNIYVSAPLEHPHDQECDRLRDEQPHERSSRRAREDRQNTRADRGVLHTAHGKEARIVATEDAEIERESEDDMMAAMGFGGFGSTKVSANAGFLSPHHSTSRFTTNQ